MIESPLQFKTAPGAVHSIASDGPHVYLQTDQGMYKLGSGYGGTVKGRVYAHRPDFEPRDAIQYCPEFHGRCLRFFNKLHGPAMFDDRNGFTMYIKWNLLM